MATSHSRLNQAPRLHANFLKLVRLAYSEIVRKHNPRSLPLIEDFMKLLFNRLKGNRDQSVPRDEETLYWHIECALLQLHNEGNITLPPAYLPRKTSSR